MPPSPGRLTQRGPAAVEYIPPTDDDLWALRDTPAHQAKHRAPRGPLTMIIAGAVAMAVAVIGMVLLATGALAATGGPVAIPGTPCRQPGQVVTNAHGTFVCRPGIGQPAGGLAWHTIGPPWCDRGPCTPCGGYCQPSASPSRMSPKPSPDTSASAAPSDTPSGVPSPSASAAASPSASPAASRTPAAGASSPAAGVTPPDSGLPDTGTRIGWALLVGGLALLLGVALVGAAWLRRGPVRDGT